MENFWTTNDVEIGAGKFLTHANSLYIGFSAIATKSTPKSQDGANLDSPDLDTALLDTVMDNIRR